MNFLNKIQAIATRSIAQNYPLSPQLIEKYRDDLDWLDLSANVHLPSDNDLLAAYEKKWAWSEIARNAGFPINEANLKRWKKRLDWHYLSQNPTFPASDADFMEKYASKINWHWLSQNAGFPWSIAFLEKWKTRWAADSLAQNPALRGNPKIWAWVENNFPKENLETGTTEFYARRRFSNFVKKFENSGLEFAVSQADLQTPISEITPEMLERNAAALHWWLVETCETLPWSEAFFGRFSDFWQNEGLQKNTAFWKNCIKPHLQKTSVSALFEAFFHYKHLKYYVLRPGDDDYGIVPSLSFNSEKSPQSAKIWSAQQHYQSTKPDAEQLEGWHFDLSGIKEGPFRFRDFHGVGNHYFSLGVNFALSPLAKAILEKFKLPPHQFIPCQVLLPATKKSPEEARPYFVLSINYEQEWSGMDFSATTYEVWTTGFEARCLRTVPAVSINNLEQFTAFDKETNRGREYDYLKIKPQKQVYSHDLDAVVFDFQLVVNENVKRAFEKSGAEGFGFRKLKTDSIVIAAAETPARRAEYSEILNTVFGQNQTAASPISASVQEYEKLKSWAEKVLAQEGLVKAYYAKLPPVSPENTLEIALREKEIELDVLFPENFRKAVLSQKMPKKRGEYEILPISGIYRQDESYLTTHPETAKSVVIGENGIGDSIGFLLKSDDFIQLDTTLFGFEHEVGEVVKMRFSV